MWDYLSADLFQILLQDTRSCRIYIQRQYHLMLCPQEQQHTYHEEMIDIL